MQRAYRKLMGRLTDAGVVRKKYILNNKILESMKDLIRNKSNRQIELVLPGCHRRNTTEVAIHSFKCYFLSILPGVADDFLLYLWDSY